MDVNGLGLDDRSVGSIFCLLSAAGFGAMAVFGKLAYHAGVSVDTLLLVRFGLAGALLLALALARGALRNLSRRAVLVGLAMGACGYAAQAGLYFSALSRIDASLVALILYVYPVLVMTSAIALAVGAGVAAAGAGVGPGAVRDRTGAGRGGGSTLRRAGRTAGAGRRAHLHRLHPGR